MNWRPGLLRFGDAARRKSVLDALEREWERLQKETTRRSALRPLQDFVASHTKTGDVADKAFFDDLSEEE